MQETNRHSAPPRLIPVLLLLSLAAPVHAGLRDEPKPRDDSSDSSIHLGLFGRFTAFDHDIEDSHALGGGVRLGVTPARHWAIEADASVNDMIRGGNLMFTPIHLRLVRSIPLGVDTGWQLGAGGVLAEFDDAELLEGPGLSFHTGIQQRAGRHSTVRADVVVDYVFLSGDEFFIGDGYYSPLFGPADDDWHFGFEVGLQHGGGPR